MPTDKKAGYFGDIQGFLKLTVYNVALLLVIACVGASVVSVVKMDVGELELLFPTDISKAPYPQSEDSAEVTKIGPIFEKYQGDNKIESLLTAMLEYFYPMKTKSFPYKNWFVEPKFEGTYSYVVAKWMVVTCANAFMAWRSWYMSIVILGKAMLAFMPFIFDLFLFYVWPYILMYAVMLPVVPLIGSIMAFIGSITYNVPGAPLLSLAPIAGICVAVANIVAGGIFNIYAWIISFFIYIGGFALGFVNVAWWMGIGVAIWAWSIMQLFLMPLLMTDGISKTISEISNHTRSISIIFLFLTFQAAMTYLTPSASIGIIVGVAMILAKVFFFDKPTVAA